MNCYTINSNDFEETFKQLGCENGGAKIIAKKTDVICLFINDLHTGAANILKQDALSIGADLAVPRGTILNTTPTVDCILVGNSKHFEILAKKELAQPFGLKELAKQLKSFIKPKKQKTKIMGIINANDDSFYSQSRFSGDDAIKKIEQMICDGADIIDIGGVSSRPGSDIISAQEELERIKDICDTIKEKQLYKKVEFSIDSYTPSVIEYALQSGFSIINDITGLVDDEVCKLAAHYNATVVIMHMLGSPKTMQNNPSYEDVIMEVNSFFEKQITKAKLYGIKDIVLDVGIGFGKTLEHNLMLLRNMDTYLHFGYPILLGASRKSMIEHLLGTTPNEERLAGTLAIHLEGINKGASLIRCHDVKEHYQAIQLHEAIQGI